MAGLLRERLPGQVVSADSAALFHGLPVLTAAPPYPAQLVGIVPLAEDVSVGRYQALAHAAVDAALEAGETPIVAGGTGLYFRAALSTLELPPPPEPGVREHWTEFYERSGPEEAHNYLGRIDPDAGARVHPNDRRRVIRALELAASGSSLAPPRDRLWEDDARHPTVMIALDASLELLDERIEHRTRQMAELGAVQEASAAWEGPAFGHRAQGARPSRVRHPAGRRGDRSGRLVDEAPGPLPAQVAAAPVARRYPRRRSSTRGDRG